ncbi:hypothetical protein GYMLUDRAFT_251378 [Collybiopsis luxurians FD-317 M1]|uniref:Unplaced genomic scaffold GYMLUscaffold_98, whole genome shotgun sequence n=1 Tax=Collybiopsis luxurians FD-317 M1 TaxID=944289 RepID=A0A0D0BRH8_9AGAR|nr:hypothetical protein GYMLUDRAFT_251378 [Collybiopsis luxurians FD-317 M1]
MFATPLDMLNSGPRISLSVSDVSSMLVNLQSVQNQLLDASTSEKGMVQSIDNLVYILNVRNTENCEGWMQPSSPNQLCESFSFSLSKFQTHMPVASVGEETKMADRACGFSPSSQWHQMLHQHPRFIFDSVSSQHTEGQLEGTNPSTAAVSVPSLDASSLLVSPPPPPPPPMPVNTTTYQVSRWYVVTVGHAVDIFSSLTLAHMLVYKVKGRVMQSFGSYKEASNEFELSKALGLQVQMWFYNHNRASASRANPIRIDVSSVGKSGCKKQAIEIFEERFAKMHIENMLGKEHEAKGELGLSVGQSEHMMRRNQIQSQLWEQASDEVKVEVLCHHAEQLRPARSDAATSEENQQESLKGKDQESFESQGQMSVESTFAKSHPGYNHDIVAPFIDYADKTLQFGEEVESSKTDLVNSEIGPADSETGQVNLETGQVEPETFSSPAVSKDSRPGEQAVDQDESSKPAEHVVDKNEIEQHEASLSGAGVDLAIEAAEANCVLIELGLVPQVLLQTTHSLPPSTDMSNVNPYTVSDPYEMNLWVYPWVYPDGYYNTAGLGALRIDNSPISNHFHCVVSSSNSDTNTYYNDNLSSPVSGIYDHNGPGTSYPSNPISDTSLSGIVSSSSTSSLDSNGSSCDADHLRNLWPDNCNAPSTGSVGSYATQPSLNVQMDFSCFTNPAVSGEQHDLHSQFDGKTLNTLNTITSKGSQASVGFTHPFNPAQDASTTLPANFTPHGTYSTIHNPTLPNAGINNRNNDAGEANGVKQAKKLSRKCPDMEGGISSKRARTLPIKQHDSHARCDNAGTSSTVALAAGTSATTQSSCVVKPTARVQGL